MESQEQESTNMEPIRYAAEQCCVLCRNKVQFYCNQYDYDSSGDVEELENWETAVMALGCKYHLYSNKPLPCWSTTAFFLC
jgi:hypothetical protein